MQRKNERVFVMFNPANNACMRKSKGANVQCLSINLFELKVVKAWVGRTWGLNQTIMLILGKLFILAEL